MAFNYNFREVPHRADPKEMVEEGFYLMEIGETTERTSRTGDPQVRVKLRILERLGEHHSSSYQGWFLWDWVTFKQDGSNVSLTRRVLRVIDEPFKGEVTVSPNHWLKKRLLVELRHREWNGALHPVVKNYWHVDEYPEVQWRATHLRTRVQAREIALLSPPPQVAMAYAEMLQV